MDLPPVASSTTSDIDPLTLFSTVATLHSMNFASLDDAFDAYLNFVMRALNVRSAFIASLRADTLHVIDARDDHGCGIERGEMQLLEDTFCQYVRATVAPMVIMDATRDARVQHAATRTEQTIGSYLGVPLIARDGAVWGTLCALDPLPNTFFQYHVDLMRIVARHLALLFENEQHLKTSTAQEERRSTAERTRDDQAAILRIVAHDLRNPLSCILGQVELLHDEYLGPLLTEQRDMLENTYHSILFANRLVSDLLDAAAAETRTLSILRSQFDPYKLAQSVLDTYQSQARNRRLALLLNATTTVPLMTGDADRLRQILLNYVGNALRYTRVGSIQLRIDVIDTDIQFTVIDTGPGISDQAQEDIWNIYTRNNLEGKGLGLGLYIVDRLASAMQGEVGVKSEVGRGSSFWIRLSIHGGAPLRTAWMEGGD